MNSAVFCLPDDAFDIDLDFLCIEMDREPACGKSVISRLHKRGPQFANDLAQRGAGLFLVRPAPQQADKPLAALLFGLGQGEIAQNGAGLLGSKLDRPAFESYGEASRQREGKTRGGSGARPGSPLIQLVNVSRLPHPKNSVPGRNGADYISATPPVYIIPPPV